MAESFNEKRAVFPPGKQREFLNQVKQHMAIATMVRVVNRSERAIRDWRREKFSMPFPIVRILSKQAHVPMPKNVRIRDAYAHIAKAGKMGMAAVIRKYGCIPQDEKRRKESWRRWWETEGKYKKNPIYEPRAVPKPKPSTKLAEFIGILMGDGSLSRYQATVSLNRVDDREYAFFVEKLFTSLFKFKSGRTDRPKISVIVLTFSRIELVRYLHSLGLPIGDKIRQELDIPQWIRDNRAYEIACVRGLVDTDGCIFTHRYKIKEKWYAYKKLSFTTASPSLTASVFSIFKQIGLHPRISRGGRDVRLDSKTDMLRYFNVVGTHNPKHLRRYEL